MAEEILISIEIEKGDNEKQVDALTRKINDLTNANKNLHKQNLDMIKAGQQNSKEYLENSRQIEINKQKIQEATASRKGLVQTILAEDDSIKGLRARNAELIRQRDQLSTKTDEGKAKIKEINEELDKNNEVIQENVSKLEQQKINIGNYASALDGVLPGLSGFVSGVQRATEAAKLFIATPLGLVLAALALALSPIISFLKSTGDGMDLVEKKTEGLKQGLSILQDSFNDLGRQMIEGEGFFGQFVQALVKSNPIVLALNASISTLRLILPGLAKDFDEAQKAGEDYAEAMDEITTAQQFFEATAGREENAIKRLILQSKNRTESEEDRIALIDQALEKEQRLVQARVGFATAEAAALINLAKQRTGLVRTEEETLQDFGTRLAQELDKTDNELRDKILNSLKAVEQARGESIGVEEKLQNQRDALLDKADEKEKKLQEERLARAARINQAIFALEEIRLQRQVSGATGIEDRINKEIALENLRKEHLLDNDKLLAQEKAVIEQQSQDTIAAIRLKGQEDQEALNQRNIEANNKLEELRLQQQVVNAESLQARIDAEIALETERTLLLLENAELLESEKQLILEKGQANINAILAKGAKDQLAADQKLADAKNKIREQNKKNEESAISAGLSLLKEAFGEAREVAAAGAAISTYRAAAAALEPPPVGFGPIFGPILAALTVARGFLQVSKILGIKFFKGGLLQVKKMFGFGGIAETGGVLNGPLHTNGGIPFTVGGRPGFEAEGGEALINRRSTAMFKNELSAINQAGGGVAFGRGGVARRYQTGSVIAGTQTRQASQVVDGRAAMRDAMQSIMNSMPPIIVTVQDINERQTEVSDQSQRAIVA
jgi:hypothetical protein